VGCKNGIYSCIFHAQKTRAHIAKNKRCARTRGHGQGGGGGRRLSQQQPYKKNQLAPVGGKISSASLYSPKAGPTKRNTIHATPRMMAEYQADWFCCYWLVLEYWLDWVVWD
jgi:hypothetical protein